MKYSYHEAHAKSLKDPSLWTRIMSAGPQFSPDMQFIRTIRPIPELKDLDAWPWWAKMIRLLRTKRDGGVGDTVYRLAAPIRWFKKKQCRSCSARHIDWSRRFPYIVLVLVLVLDARAFIDPAQLTIQEARQWPTKSAPNPSPTHAIALIALQPDQPINTNTFTVSWDPDTVAKIIIWDGTSPGTYNESNTIDTQDGTVTNARIYTTNQLPIYINAQAEDQYDDVSWLANEVGYNGWTPYSWTNWLYLTNLTAIGPDPRRLTNTNAALAIFTNSPGPLFFISSGYSAFPTFYLAPTPMPGASPAKPQHPTRAPLASITF